MQECQQAHENMMAVKIEVTERLLIVGAYELMSSLKFHLEHVVLIADRV